MKIKIVKDWYETGVKLFSKKELELVPNNIYCICGCNGYGKTTLMKQIKEYAKKNGTDLESYYTNPFNGFFGNSKELKNNIILDFNKKTKVVKNEFEAFHLSALEFQISNGEGIIQNLGRTLQLFRKYLKEENNQNKTVWVFFDDVDAGTSIDVLLEIKRVISYMVEDCKKINNKFYIILPINAYEMTFFDNLPNRCIDALTFTELYFKNYDDYKDYVLKTRTLKDKRFEKLKEKENDENKTENSI